MAITDGWLLHEKEIVEPVPQCKYLTNQIQPTRLSCRYPNLGRYGAKFLEIAKSHFERADKLFDIFLIREPNNPYLLLYKGMNLTHLSKARESVLYLNESLRIKPDIFDRHELLGIICYWKHIDSGYAKVWKSAFDKY